MHASPQEVCPRRIRDPDVASAALGSRGPRPWREIPRFERREIQMTRPPSGLLLYCPSRPLHAEDRVGRVAMNCMLCWARRPETTGCRTKSIGGKRPHFEPVVDLIDVILMSVEWHCVFSCHAQLEGRPHTLVPLFPILSPSLHLLTGPPI